MAAVFVAANLILFAAYRCLFVASFSSESIGLRHGLGLLLAGVRIDCALLTLEVAALALLGLAVRARFLFYAMLVLTYLHGVLAASNYFFFRERNLPLGEKLFAYLLAPADLLVYGGGFLVSNPVVSILLAVLTAGWFYTGWRLGRKVPGTRLAFSRSWKARGIGAIVLALLICPALDIYTEKQDSDTSGFKVRIANPRYYQEFTDFALNQAVGNPLYDLLRVYAPTYLRQSYQDRMDPAEALRLCSEELQTNDAPAATPLLRSVDGLPEFGPLGIRNVIVIQVEGLSASMMARQENGRPVMKFLNKLATEGIYCPNIVQGFSATAGGVFTVTTGFPKGSFREIRRRFTPYELNATYATLPRILGRSGYAHLFAEGFRESYQEYVSFMSNQGFACYAFPEIGRRLEAKGKKAEADGLQGYFDGYFLGTCADIIGEVEEPNFVMQLSTLTSHSPWTLPSGFKSEFGQPVNQVFNYVDQSIENFVAAVDRKGRMEKTVLAIVADHTSVTFGKDFMERIRVPLIVYSPQMKNLGINREIKSYGSQMDVVPTILSLIPGQHRYAGFGQSLLMPEAEDRTLYSGFVTEGWIFRGDWALCYTPDEDKSSLYQRQGDRLDLVDVSRDNAQTTALMKKHFLSMYETGRRLAQEQRIFPSSAANAKAP